MDECVDGIVDKIVEHDDVFEHVMADILELVVAQGEVKVSPLASFEVECNHS